jgi:hypothetical protein
MGGCDGRLSSAQARTLGAIPRTSLRWQHEARSGSLPPLDLLADTVVRKYAGSASPSLRSGTAARMFAVAPHNIWQIKTSVFQAWFYGRLYFSGYSSGKVALDLADGATFARPLVGMTSAAHRCAERCVWRIGVVPGERYRAPRAAASGSALIYWNG